MVARRPRAAHWVLATITLAALAANACRFGVGGSAGLRTSTASVTVAPTAGPSPTLPGRTAVLNELVGDVQSGPASGGKDQPSANGQILPEGSRVRTETASKVKISLSDGSLLRLRPNTLITLDRLITDPNNPVSRLLLALGKVYVILRSGQLEVQADRHWD